MHKDNVNVQFLGFEKSVGLVLAKYEINGGSFGVLAKTLYDNKYQYISEFKEIKENMHEYALPYETEKIQKMCNELIGINNKLLEIEKEIKDFKVESMKEEAQRIVNRLMGK